MNEMLKTVARKYAELYIKAGVGLTIGLAKVLEPARKMIYKLEGIGDNVKGLTDYQYKTLMDELKKVSNSWKFSFEDWVAKRDEFYEPEPTFYEPEPTAADLQKLDMMIEGLKTEGLFKGFELLDLTGPRTEDATDEITDVNGELAKYPTMQSYGTTDNDIARGITGKNIDGLYIPTGVSNPGYTIPSQEINAWKDDQRNKEVAKTTNSPFGYCDPMKMAEFVLEKGKEVAVKAKAKTKNSAHKNKSTKKNKSKSKTFTKKTKSTKKAKK